MIVGLSGLREAGGRQCGACRRYQCRLSNLADVPRDRGAQSPTPLWSTKVPLGPEWPLSISIWQRTLPVNPGSLMLMNTHEGFPR